MEPVPLELPAERLNWTIGQCEDQTYAVLVADVLSAESAAVFFVSKFGNKSRKLRRSHIPVTTPRECLAA
jgi:hypothetical protein